MQLAPDVAQLDAELDETRKALTDAAHRRFGSIPSSLLVQHVLVVTEGADFAVREAALEALDRRWRFAVRDGLEVATRPPHNAVFGHYTTSRSTLPAARGKKSAARGKKSAARGKKSSGRGKKSAARRSRRRGQPRPYTSVFESLAPLVVSCDCPDYLRSSLGLCKHLLVVLDDVHGSKKRLAAAQSTKPSPVRQARLVWDPRLPLTGELDRLAGLRLIDSASGRSRVPASLERVRRAFRGNAPDARCLQSPKQRRELLGTLHSALHRTRSGSTLEGSPAARALVAEELARAERAERNEAGLGRSLTHLRSLRRKLYPYQREGVTRFLKSGRLLLADDMGLGKTTQAIAACHALFESGRIRRGVLIVPASLKSQWLREWQETTQVPCSLVEGTPEQRAAQYRRLRSGFLILNYEQLLRDADHVQRLAPDLVVLDEAQRIKNYATKSAVYVKSLRPEFRLVLTGTPMENRLEELASILDWVDDVALAPKWRLAPWHLSREGDAAQPGRFGGRNLDTLRTRLAPSLVRRVRKEVLSQLPARTDSRVPVEMTSQQRAEHDDLHEPIARLVHTSKRRPLTQPEFLRLMSLLTQQRIISNGLGQLRFEELWPTYKDAPPDPALLDGLLSPKLHELRRLISDLVVDQERKVVVFSQWRRMLRLAEWSLRDILGNAGARALFFTGAERPTQRTRSVVDFHDDPNARVLLLSDAGGVGLNLQRAANACINLELPWNPAILEQRIGRIYRIGQKQPIDIFNLVNDYGIEARIATLLGAKQALFSGLFDGTSDQVQFQTGASFLTSVEQLLEAGTLPEPPRDIRSSTDAEADELDAPDGTQSTQDLETDRAVADEVPAALNGPDAGTHGQKVFDHSPAASHDTIRSASGGLFDSLRVERTAEGGVRIEAPPEAAETLMEMFGAMAKLLQAAAQRPPTS